jgi:hypothetical protein
LEQKALLAVSFLSMSEFRQPAMNKIALALLSVLTLGACSTPQQTAGTTAGAVGGALVGGPVGAVVGGVAGAVVAGPGGPIGGPYRHRCRYHDRYGNIHYGRCHV